MPIVWFSPETSTTGTATLYNTNITFNTVAMEPFKNVSFVQVGLDEEKKAIVVKPIDETRRHYGDLNEKSLLKVAVKPSYARISSTGLMRLVQEKLGVSFPKNGLHAQTTYEEKEKLLIIKMPGKESR